jgi:hypothetical protein
MAAGDSQVTICNIGLIEGLGQDPITSFDDQTKPAILCKQLYDTKRREVLRAFPWNFAKRFAQLAADMTVPPFHYANAFPLPADYITMFNLPDNDLAQWEVVGHSLYTDEGAPLNTIYISDFKDPTRFDPLFCTCLGYAVGSGLAIGILQDKKLRDQLEQYWRDKLSTARSISSQENSPVEWDVDVLLRSRR